MPVTEPDLQHLLPDGEFMDRSSLAKAPGWKGTYALLLRFDISRGVTFAGNASRLSPGWYVYAGSAYGPGGVGARLKRHFRQDKKLHWHVDQLTIGADEIWALAFRDGSECEIVDRIRVAGLGETALPGFGSSDCTHCEAHLLRWTG